MKYWPAGPTDILCRFGLFVVDPVTARLHHRPGEVRLQFMKRARAKSPAFTELERTNQLPSGPSRPLEVFSCLEYRRAAVA